MKLAGTLALAAAISGCNYTSSGETAKCTVTLSGALNGTYDCRPATTIWIPASDTGAFQFNVPQSASNPAITVSIGWHGEPREGHYRNTDADADGQVSIITDTQVWSMRVGKSSGGSTPGDYDLDFRNVSGGSDRYAGVAYTTAGTLDARFDEGSVYDVSVHVEF